MGFRQRPSWHADAVRGAVHPIIPSIGWRTGQSATQKRPSVRAKRVANPPFLDFDSETRGRRASWRVWQKTSVNRLLDASLPLTKQMITPLIARRLAADQLPRRALAGSLTTNRRDRPSYSSPQQRPPPSRSAMATYRIRRAT